jgi:hypothetical protein
MPKERVYDVAGLFDVIVGWTPDRDVQVAVVTNDGRPLSEVVESWRNDNSQEHQSDDDSYVRSDGIWSTMDRASINRLITMLRKARDAAFGADA